MAIATLTTDWEKHDYYVAALKGEILKRNSAAAIVDITHQIQPFLLQGAAYIVKNSFHHFPENTVHIIGVDCEPTPKSPIVAVQYQNHYFVSADNGILGLICDNQPSAIVRIDYVDFANGFNALIPFAETAAALTRGTPILELGEEQRSLQFMPMMLPVIDSSFIIGNVIHIDSFDNIITNITREEIDKVGKGRPFEILIQSNRYRIRKISKAYHAVEDGEFVAIINSSGHLEIAQTKGRIATLLNMDLGSTVRINFINK